MDRRKMLVDASFDSQISLGAVVVQDVLDFEQFVAHVLSNGEPLRARCLVEVSYELIDVQGIGQIILIVQNEVELCEIWRHDLLLLKKLKVDSTDRHALLSVVLMHTLMIVKIVTVMRFVPSIPLFPELINFG